MNQNGITKGVSTDKKEVQSMIPQAHPKHRGPEESNARDTATG